MDIIIYGDVVQVDPEAPVKKTLRDILISRDSHTTQIILEIDGKVISEPEQIPETFGECISMAVKRGVSCHCKSHRKEVS